MYSRFVFNNGELQKLPPKSSFDTKPTLVRGYDRNGYKVVISFEHTLEEVMGVVSAYILKHPDHDIKMDSDSQAIIDRSIRLEC